MSCKDERTKFWKDFYPDADASIETTVLGALALARKIGDESGAGMRTFITGSLYLVRIALPVLQGSEQRFEMIEVQKERQRRLLRKETESLTSRC